ncbi:HepT-like ribonuclease domain-containing protein [Palaeococcus sp. (in: euryarchaeotes)]|uniref:HepT-like ribonuclease domain-containing protein n=1 Tax=Palaeococcus sp. (in: euryarchaeotes) TaxID=2820298 RepID=UPI0025CB9CC9|nr:DUF86 domain-containing protein [Palaeococcus sp. (in: euryarchaeotes)]MCD6560116.1 DUF86 domain-containing protein [Palaeococcus sp. (in: euryarchaeotes)]
MKRDYTLYLADIIEAMESIELFIEGMDFKSFVADDKTVSAVLRKLEIIGEATKHVPPHIREKYDDVPWKQMAGMRDKLIHFYFGVDYALVWRTINLRIPKIKDRLIEILSELKGDQNGTQDGRGDNPR